MNKAQHSCVTRSLEYHCVLKCCIVLPLSVPSGRRMAHLYKSPSEREGTIEYVVTHAGIRSASHAEVCHFDASNNFLNSNAMQICEEFLVGSWSGVKCKQTIRLLQLMSR